jgi:hypothetical protein
MRPEKESLTSQIVERRPVRAGGASGNRLERVTLRDGRELMLKRVSPEWDWLSRATNDTGRIVSMWADGVFDRLPPVIDHATVGVEAEDGAWSVFMSDVSHALVPDGHKLDRTGVQRVLAAMATLHKTFWGEALPDLCGLEDRYRLLSPETARREKALGNPVGDIIAQSWDAFSEHVPSEIAEVILTIVERPALLADQLELCVQTLIHGDVRLSNLGLSDDRVVLIDWGERTGTAPAAVELASFLVFDGLQLDVPREEVIAEFRGHYGDRFEERALQLALIGGLVQLGSYFGLLIISDNEEQIAATKSDLSWWTATVDKAFETWSPR